jgi:hypothetical protein
VPLRSYEKLGRIADQENLEGRVSPAWPDPVADPVGKQPPLGQPNPVRGLEMEQRLGASGLHGRGEPQEHDTQPM